MEEHTPDPTSRPGYSRLWLVVAVALVAGAVWAGMALAASRSASGPASSPAFAHAMSTGYVASKAASSNCPNMGGSSGSSGSTTTPGL